jgi:hypothetical protein
MYIIIAAALAMLAVVIDRRLRERRRAARELREKM